MPIIVNLDVMMAKRKMSLNELSEKVGLTLSNLSILKTGKAKAVRFSTLEAICNALDCQPGDILEYARRRKLTRDLVQNGLNDQLVSGRAFCNKSFTFNPITKSSYSMFPVKLSAALLSFLFPVCPFKPAHTASATTQK